MNSNQTETIDNMETFFGILLSTQDALVLLAACANRTLPMISRRLDHLDRRNIRSGSIFVFDEKESSIKRWTDGRIWSPSRISGNFLMYKEVERKEKAYESYAETQRNSLTKDDEDTPSGPITSNKGTYYFKKDGLIKKTMSAVYKGSVYHVISYYSKSHINSLVRVSYNPTLRGIEVPSDIEVHCLQVKKTIKRRPSTGLEVDSHRKSVCIQRHSLNHLITASELVETSPELQSVSPTTSTVGSDVSPIIQPSLAQRSNSTTSSIFSRDSTNETPLDSCKTESHPYLNRSRLSIDLLIDATQEAEKKPSLPSPPILENFPRHSHKPSVLYSPMAVPKIRTISRDYRPMYAPVFLNNKFYPAFNFATRRSQFHV